MQSTHPNSKIITVKRKLSGIEEQNDELEELYGQTIIKSIGAYIAGEGVMANASGLESWEIDLLLPFIIKVGADKDPAYFAQKVDEYYSNIKNGVGKNGLPLEIGLTKDNSAPLSPDNKPINIAQYVAYRHIIGHPWVAKSEKEAKGSPIKYFWIEDKTAKIKETISTQDQQDEALKLYLVAKEDKEKILMFAELMADSITENEGKTFEEISTTLRKKVDSKAAKFISVATDKNLQVKYFIRQCLSNNILRTVGTSYLDVESGNVIGNTEEATVIYLNDKANIKEKAILEAKLQDKLKTKNKK